MTRRHDADQQTTASDGGLAEARPIIARRRELLGQLDALSQRQDALIESGDTERLLGLLGERGRLVDALAALSDGFEPYAACWTEMLSAAEEDVAAECRGELAALERLTGEITRRDEASAKSIRARRDRLADRLAGIGTGKAAVSAYAPQSQPTGLRLRGREA